MDYTNLQQISTVIGYVSQNLELQGNGKDADYWTKFSVISRKNGGKAVQIVCMARGDIARQFVEQHTKGSIVCLFGEIVSRYSPETVYRISNQFNVLGWFYFADIQATFPGISDEEHVYLLNRLKAFRESTEEQRKKIMDKIAPSDDTK